MAMTMMQGDSYPIFVNLTLNGNVLTPNMIEDLEICVGDDLRYTLSESTLGYDSSRGQWYFWPTQEETLEMQGSYTVFVRAKFANEPTEVYGFKLDKITVKDANCSEVL